MDVTLWNNGYSLFMIYAGFKRVGTWWNYKNVSSPFYRLYYIEKGKGVVYVNGKGYELVPGMLFLIPKFALHSYECEDFMDHYYICFFDDLAGNAGIPDPMRLRLSVDASPMTLDLMKRYLELNPSRHLQTSDPRRYGNDRIIYDSHGEDISSLTARCMESQGILLQLFARFVTPESVRKPSANSWHGKLDQVVQYVNANLDKHISVPELADLMCLTADHFSKVFKKCLGMSPCEYIQLKRMKRAQVLLLSTNLSIMQVGERVGISNPSQFTRLFTKIAQCSPKEYRAKQLSI